ncbi:nucleotide exchange factor GrpE [Leucobacter japonicus]|uniref:nucleotide exchange factor GrpE n=1 Tax=Leucobacter japonicus TaxID=1461259 RepID=UPI0006A7A709|nr:nucleotide exchange factor GrpE [Leucobacter japonicus]
MANEEQRTPGQDPNADEVPAQEPESQDSGSAGQASEQDAQADLTVDDILGAEQSEDAAAADDANNPYLDDLRRLTAEYANYRKRTEANALLEKQRAIAAAVTPMLTVLDDLDRAEKHGDLTEGTAFATIAQKIRGTFERLGVQSFGEAGEVFDPQLHEAIAQVPVPGTEQQTVLDVVERGYRIGDVELRPAKVAVAVGADG